MVLLKWPRLFGPDACGKCYIKKISRSALNTFVQNFAGAITVVSSMLSIRTQVIGDMLCYRQRRGSGDVPGT